MLEILVGRLTSPYDEIPQQQRLLFSLHLHQVTVWKCHGDTISIADMMIATEQQRTLALLTLAIVVANVASLPSFLSANWISHTVHVCHAFWESIWAGVSAFRGFGKQSGTNVCRASIAASNKPASELSHEFLLTAVMTDSCQSSNQTAGAMGLFLHLEYEHSGWGLNTLIRFLKWYTISPVFFNPACVCITDLPIFAHCSCCVLCYHVVSCFWEVCAHVGKPETNLKWILFCSLVIYRKRVKESKSEKNSMNKSICFFPIKKSKVDLIALHLIALQYELDQFKEASVCLSLLLI